MAQRAPSLHLDMTPSFRIGRYGHWPTFLLTVLLASACGGGGSGAGAGAAPVEERSDTQPQAPYTRLLMVDAGNPRADDNGPATSTQPLRTIGAAMRMLRAGDDVVIAAGTYREFISVPTLAAGAAPVRIRAATPHTVLVKGSDEIGGWTQASGVYSVAWSGDEPQQIYRAGVALQQIAGSVFGGYPTNPPPDLVGLHAAEGGIWPGRRSGSAGTLPVDSFVFEGGRLHVRLSTALGAGEKLEVSTRRHVLQGADVNRLTVRGLDFAHANTSAIYRQGAVQVLGADNVLTDLVVRDMDSACVQIGGSDTTLSDSVIERCGQLGLLGRGLRMTVANNRIADTNLRGFNKWWEAGGMKFIGDGGLVNSTIRNNVVTGARGDGIWLDWRHSGNLIEGNTAAYNEGFGIHHEASRSATIRANFVYGNGQRGIHLIESADCTIEANAVFGNAYEGIAVVDGARSAADATLRPTGNRVLGNAVAWNDIDRNWVQLVLPGLGFASSSDRNVYKAVVLAPRMSLGFVGPSNPAYVSLQAWRIATSTDGSSTEQTLTMPTTVKTAINARRLLQASELPSFLAAPGTQ